MLLQYQSEFCEAGGYRFIWRVNLASTLKKTPYSKVFIQIHLAKLAYYIVLLNFVVHSDQNRLPDYMRAHSIEQRVILR